MRKVILILIITFVFSLLLSETMKIHLSNGETVEFNTSEIQEITFGADVSIDDVVKFISQIPIKFLKNCPNPFNPTTTISFELVESGKTQVEIFNIKGQKVKTLLNEEMNIGKHSVIWKGKDNDGNQISSGMYFYKVSVNGEQKINKMLMLK